MHQQAYFLPLHVVSKGLIGEGRHLGKVATVVVQLEVMQMDDVCGDDIEEVPIMRHHDQRLLPTLQVLLQHSTERLRLLCFQTRALSAIESPDGCFAPLSAWGWQALRPGQSELEKRTAVTLEGVPLPSSQSTALRFILFVDMSSSSTVGCMYNAMLGHPQYFSSMTQPF